jgi:hypothetical protein
MARLNALGELAAGMAHELNQPLTAVMANVQAANRLLARRAAGAAAPRLQAMDAGRAARRAGPAEVVGAPAAHRGAARHMGSRTCSRVPLAPVAALARWTCWSPSAAKLCGAVTVRVRATPALAVLAEALWRWSRSCTTC